MACTDMDTVLDQADGAIAVADGVILVNLSDAHGFREAFNVRALIG